MWKKQEQKPGSAAIKAAMIPAATMAIPVMKEKGFDGRECRFKRSGKKKKERVVRIKKKKKSSGVRTFLSPSWMQALREEKRIDWFEERKSLMG